MSRLLRICTIAAILSGLSTVIYIFNIFNVVPVAFEITGDSPLRLIGFSTLFSLTLILSGLSVLLWKYRGLDDKISVFLDIRLKKEQIAYFVIIPTLFVFLVAALALLNIMVSGDVRFVAFLQRIFPFWLLGISYPLLIITSPFLCNWRSKTLFILAMSISLIAFSIWLGNRLLEDLLFPSQFLFTDLITFQIIFVLFAPLFSVVYLSLSRGNQMTLAFTVVMATGVFLIQWELWPRKLRYLMPNLAMYSLYFVFGLPLLAFSILSLWQWLKKSAVPRFIVAIKALSFVGLLLLGYLYYGASVRHAKDINISTSFSDQNAYMNIIREARRLNFNYTGDQNRMPVYPFFQAVFYRENMSDENLFNQGKFINIVLSLFILLFLFLIFLKYLPFFQATLLIIIITFTLYIFKSPYIQSEIAFYFLSFVSFVLYIAMLNKPSWLISSAAGFLAGLAYLTKGTILLSIPLFIAVYLLKASITAYNNYRAKGSGSLHKLLRQISYLFIFLIVCLVTIFPYINSMHQRFDRYFYNVNTTVYVWLDSWDQAVQFRNSHDFTERWPPTDLPADQVPSLQNYIRNHTINDILDRFTQGLETVYKNALLQYSILNYPLVYLWIFCLVIAIRPKNVAIAIRKHPYVIIFALLYFTAYLAAFSWYAPIGPGRRFTYGLHIPFFFSVFVSVNELSKFQLCENLNGSSTKGLINIGRFFDLSNLVVSSTLSYIIWLIITQALFYDRYGS